MPTLRQCVISVSGYDPEYGITQIGVLPLHILTLFICFLMHYKFPSDV